MGTRGFEPRTSPLSGVRSSQLSYAPVSRSPEVIILIGLARESTTYRTFRANRVRSVRRIEKPRPIR
jgi:hypothetical protein